MGGAAGHLKHPFENADLKIGELKEIFKLASAGKLEHVTEKLDGINAMFTFSPRRGLVFARNNTDIKSGGLDVDALEAKYSGHPVREAFVEAHKTLSSAVSTLSNDDITSVFAAGTLWYSIEIIYAGAPNVVNYDSNSIVFHESPVFENVGGSIVKSTSGAGVETLATSIEKMQRAVSEKSWRIHAPVMVAMKRLADKSVLRTAVSSINDLMSQHRLTDADTIGDLLVGECSLILQDEGLNVNVAQQLATRIMSVPGAPKITNIVNEFPKNAETIRSLYDRANELQKQSLRNLETIVRRFAVGVLSGIQSSLLADNDAEVTRLRSDVKNAIAAISSSGGPNATAKLKNELERIDDVDDIVSAMEGIVFFYKGSAYKFTGSFAPVNQILNIFRYKLNESASGVIITEGGHAFKGLSELAIEDFNEIFDDLIDELNQLGLENVAPIGSTGKKKLMGDIDLVAHWDGTQQELYDAVVDTYGAALKVGATIVSFPYPYVSLKNKKQKQVQVDIMIGDPAYISWARAGTANTPDHPDYSVAKGSIRNLYISALADVASMLSLKKYSEIGDTREKYAVDFDRGLHINKQTMIGKSGKRLKNWQNTDRKFVTKDPGKIIKILLGSEFGISDTNTLESLVAATRRSKQLRGHYKDVVKIFMKKLDEFAALHPDVVDYESIENVLS